jgi:inner membrane transporter RhtA
VTARAGTTPAILLVIAGLACQEVGASLAVLLFPAVGPLGMVMLRLVFSAVLLLAIARPRLRGHDPAAWMAVVTFGLVLAVMNGLFYLALERLALGVTVTIEVLGPLVLSIIASRRASAWLWALLALAGVFALGGGGWGDLDPLGVVFALGAAASWAFYILSSARVGRVFPKLDGLALAMTVGAMLSIPFGIADAGTALLRWDLLALGAAVAVLSSMIPYAFELIALRRLPAASFAILMSLAPATAALAGFIFLSQELSVIELAGIGLVIAASIGAVRSSGRAAREAAEPIA